MAQKVSGEMDAALVGCIEKQIEISNKTTEHLAVLGMRLESLTNEVSRLNGKLENGTIGKIKEVVQKWGLTIVITNAGIIIPLWLLVRNYLATP
jgi:hypothetical protein